MPIMLPEIIAAYFHADAQQDADAVARCFTEEAVVRDEGEYHAGRDAIRVWKAQAARKYAYTVEPLTIEAHGERTTVSSRVAGDFPGSPIDLRYLFVLADEGIAGLEIKP